MESPFTNKLSTKFIRPFMVFGLLAFIIAYFGIGKLAQLSAESQLRLHGEQIAILLNQLGVEDGERNALLNALKKDQDLEDIYFFDTEKNNLKWSMQNQLVNVNEEQMRMIWLARDVVFASNVEKNSKIIVVLNKVEIYKELRALQQVSLIAIALVLFVLYGVTVLTLRRTVLRPVAELLAFIDAGKDGKIGEPAASAASSEFVELNQQVRDLFHQLKQREIMLTNAIENNPGVIYRLSRTAEGWKLIFISHRIEALSGYSVDFFYQSDRKTIRGLVHPEDQARLAETIKGATRENTPFICNYRFMHKDGSVRHITDRGLARVDAAGRVVELEGLIVDNTHTTQTLERYLEAEDIACMGSWQFDLNSRKFSWSPGVFKLFGMEPAESGPELEFYLTCIHPDDRDKFVSPVEWAIHAGENWCVEYRNLLPTGSSRYLLSRGRALRDFNGTVYALTGTVQDISERKAAEDSLTQAKLAAERSDRMKSLFLANMSHEIRTPLNGVIGAAKILAKGKLTGRQAECVDMISRCGKSLLAIINDVLDLASIEAGKTKLDHVSFDLRSELETVTILHAENAFSRGLEFASQIDVPVPSMLIGDPVRLKQIVSNLLDNAIKFTDSGNIVLRVIMQELNASSVKLSFRVKDTGIGIPLEKQDRLFKAFSQVDESMSKRHPGTGLGLSICKSLGDLMGGEMGFISTLGEGSEFYFNVWLEREVFERKSLPKKLSAVLLSNRRHLRRGLALQLQYLSCRCTEVTTVDAALEALNSAAVRQEYYSLIVLDAQTAGNFESLLNRPNAKEQLVLITTDTKHTSYPAFDSLKFNSAFTYPVRDTSWKALFESIPAVNLVAENKKDNSQKNRVLVVDDSDTDARLLEMLLQDQGYSVDCVSSGYAALEAVKLHNYSMVFMDLQMRGINGFETANIIRQIEPPGMRVPIIALTTVTSDGSQEASMAAGMDDYHGKPLDEQKLTVICTRWINSGGAFDSANKSLTG